MVSSPCDLTAAVQLIQTEGLLVSADLKHRIRRSINDHMAGGDLFLCQFIQDLRSAGALISDHLMTGTLFQFFDQLRRKAMLREGFKGLS